MAAHKIVQADPFLSNSLHVVGTISTPPPLHPLPEKKNKKEKKKIKEEEKEGEEEEED